MQADLHGPRHRRPGRHRADLAVRVHRTRTRLRVEPDERGQREHADSSSRSSATKNGSPPTRESTSYDYKGECIPMQERSTPGKLGAGNGEPAHEVHFQESVHGPDLRARCTVNGAALRDRQRPLHPRARAGGRARLQQLDSNEVHSPQQFFEAANHLETTFNMAYLDSKHIAYFSTGRLPVAGLGHRPEPADARERANTTGKASCRSNSTRTKSTRPSDLFINWNNKPAPEWGAASDELVLRSDPPRAALHGLQTENDRGQGRLDHEQGRDAGSAGGEGLADDRTSPRRRPGAEQTRRRSGGNDDHTWVEKGASRFGKNDPKAPAAAVMDAVWDADRRSGARAGAGRSTARPSSSRSSGPTTRRRSQRLLLRRRLVRVRLQGPHARSSANRSPSRTAAVYCGNGSLEACRNSLWAAIQTAAEQLSAAAGERTRRNGKRRSVRINFPPGLAAQLHDALDQPLDVPAGDRIHRPRRSALGASV